MSDKKIVPTHCERCDDSFSMYAGKGGTGYAVVREPHTACIGVGCGCPPMSETYICYKCAGEDEKTHMRTYGCNTFYLTETTDTKKKWSVSNWPGTLEFTPTHVRKGKHNMAKVRYDVWFTFEGRVWHGVQFGNNTQLLHCKATKQYLPGFAPKAVAA